VLAGDGYKNVYVVKGGAQGPQGWRVSYSFFQAGCCFKFKFGSFCFIEPFKCDRSQQGAGKKLRGERNAVASLQGVCASVDCLAGGKLPG
jgi:hypothetical protein